MFLWSGQLDGRMMSFRERSWENKYCIVPEPTRIPLPCKAESVSAGRSHLLILDSDNLIWELTAWGLVRFFNSFYSWSMSLNLLYNLFCHRLITTLKQNSLHLCIMAQIGNPPMSFNCQQAGRTPPLSHREALFMHGSRSRTPTNKS